MALLDVIQFEGPIDALVWKSPVEDFNTSSILIVDETHQALVLVNGTQYGLYGPGRHVLETPNLPLAKKIINIPTGGKTSFPCKVFYVNMVHQMAMDWGIPGNINLEDPVYQVFLKIGAHGNVNFVITDCIKFLEKLVGFRDRFNPQELINPDTGMFRGIINKWVTNDISKIMITGGISYFTISENLFEISEAVKEQLSGVFSDYGIGIQEFVIEGITANENDIKEIAEAKRLYMSRKIQGYTWQDERKMSILETAAGNTGAMGGMQGAVGGFMMGGAFGGSLADMAKSVLTGGGSTGGGTGEGSGAAGGRPGQYNKLDTLDFLRNGGGKPGQVKVNNAPAEQQGGVSFSNPQPAGQPSGVSFSNPQPAGQPSGVSFSNPQPAMQPSGVSFSNPQPAVQPSGVSFSNPQPAVQPGGMSFSNPQPGGAPFSNPQPAAPSGKKQCGHCGKMVPAEFGFCPYCGKPFPKTCPKCGREVPDDFAFCPGCGTSLK